MKLRLLIIAVLMAMPLGASAQYGRPVPYPGPYGDDVPQRYDGYGSYPGGRQPYGGRIPFALEIGTGAASCYYILGDGSNKSLRGSYAEYGQGVEDIDNHSAFVSAVWSYGLKSEIAVTGGVNWSSYLLVQYKQFGVDPYGKPRYDVDFSDPTYNIMGRTKGATMLSLMAEWRYIYNPMDLVQFYGALGLGMSTDEPILPSITLVGVRICGIHLYGFATINISPCTWLGSIGLGWRFL